MAKLIMNLLLISLLSCGISLDNGLQDKLVQKKIESFHVDLIMEIDNEDFKVDLYKFTPDTNKYHSGHYIRKFAVYNSGEVPCHGYVLNDSSTSRSPYSPNTDIRFQLPTSQNMKLFYSNILQEKDTLFSTRLDSGKYYIRFKQIYGESRICKFEVQSETDTCDWKTIFIK